MFLQAGNCLIWPNSQAHRTAIQSVFSCWPVIDCIALCTVGFTPKHPSPLFKEIKEKEINYISPLQMARITPFGPYKSVKPEYHHGKETFGWIDKLELFTTRKASCLNYGIFCLIKAIPELQETCEPRIAFVNHHLISGRKLLQSLLDPHLCLEVP